MAKWAATNVWVRIANVNLSTWCTHAEVTMEADDVEVGGMGSIGMEHTQGRRDEQFAFTFMSDFGTSAIDQTLQPIFAGGSVVLVEVAHAGASISATNPVYKGSAILLQYSPINADIGDRSEVEVTMPVNGTITRATA